MCRVNLRITRRQLIYPRITKQTASAVLVFVMPQDKLINKVHKRLAATNPAGVVSLLQENIFIDHLVELFIRPRHSCMFKNGEIFFMVNLHVPLRCSYIMNK
jgi:hypothetical protein